MSPLRVVVADQRPIIALGLANIIELAGDLEVVAVETATASLRGSLADHQPDVLVLGVGNRIAVDDLVLPDTGIDLSEVHVVAVTPPWGVTALDDLLTAGVTSLVCTTDDRDDLYRAIRSAPRNPSVLAPPQLARLLGRARDDDEDSPDTGPSRTLSPRESEVLQAILAGRSTRDIATEMDVSINTVRTHVGNVLRKLGAHSRLEAAAIAIRLNIPVHDRASADTRPWRARGPWRAEPGEPGEEGP